MVLFIWISRLPNIHISLYLNYIMGNLSFGNRNKCKPFVSYHISFGRKLVSSCVSQRTQPHWIQARNALSLSSEIQKTTISCSTTAQTYIQGHGHCSLCLVLESLVGCGYNMESSNPALVPKAKCPLWGLTEASMNLRQLMSPCIGPGESPTSPWHPQGRNEEATSLGQQME